MMVVEGSMNILCGTFAGPDLGFGIWEVEGEGSHIITVIGSALATKILRQATISWLLTSKRSMYTHRMSRPAPLYPKSRLKLSTR